MSYTLIANKGESPNYNISGWTMCAYANMYGGAPVLFPFINDTPSIIYRVSAKDAKLWGERIRRTFSIDKLKFEAFKNACEGLIEPYTDKELRNFIDEWADFLESCEGYEILG